MVAEDAFRRTMGNFVAGVTVVTLPEPAHGITVNSFTSLSLSPPLVLICIDHDTEAYDRLDGGEPGFCVNVLAADQRPLAEFFADMRELDPGPFETERTRTAITGAPVFEEAIAYLDCAVDAAHDGGDHTIYVGAVEEVGVHRPDAPALTYFRGEWGAVE
ncbi:MAG: flavin reductase family protein [Halobacteriales archaeon]